MKNILIIGLGRFGLHLAHKMTQLGNEVMIVDAEQDASRCRHDAEQDREADSDENHVVVEQILQNEVAHHQNE